MSKSRISKRAKIAKLRKVQLIMSEPSKVFKELYLTKTGLRLKLNGAKPEEYNKYQKNRYVLNPNAKVIKSIKHAT